MPKGIPLTPQEQDRRRHEIFEAAVGLFLRNGFVETSMQAIAAAAGMGKSTLYDYFRSKDEILVSYVEDAIFDLTENARQIAAQPLPAARRLNEVARAHLDYLVANKEFFIRLNQEVQRLAIDSLGQVQVQRHAYQDLLCGLVEQAITEGSFRPVNPLLAARALLALLNPAVYTTRPSGSPQQMADEVLEIFYRGVTRQA